MFAALEGLGVDIYDLVEAGATFAESDAPRIILPFSAGGPGETPPKDFARTYFCNSDFIEVSFDGADFTNALLRNVSFNGCSIRNASFRGADLENVILYATDISGSSFDGAIVIGGCLDGAIVDSADWLEVQAENPNPPIGLDQYLQLRLATYGDGGYQIVAGDMPGKEEGEYVKQRLPTPKRMKYSNYRP